MNAETIKNKHQIIFNQKAICIWFTGLSGSGKSTLAMALQERLAENNKITQYLDGDLLRNTLNNNLGFSEADRTENIRRVAEVTKLFLEVGVICINAFISPTFEIRQVAKNIIGENNYFEIYLNTSLATCENRDPKGLYVKARNGEIKNFTGIDGAFEAPIEPSLTIDTGENSIEESLDLIWEILIKKIAI